MFHQALLKILVATVVFFGGSGLFLVDSAGDGGPDPAVAAEAGPKQGGNGFLRVLKAPFKAIGKIFDRHKDDNLPRRLTEKDIKKFESARVVDRVYDARNPAPQQINNKDSVDELISEARPMIASGNLNGAIGFLTRAVSLDPKSGEAFHLLGIAYCRKGLPELTKSTFERAVKLSPRDAQTLGDYGFALYLQGDYDGAAKRLKSATKLAPKDQRNWNNLALTQYRLEKYDDALKSYVKAQGDYAGRLNLAAAFARSGRVEEAARHYEAALQLRPDSTVVVAKLVDLYNLMGRADLAEGARKSLIANGTTAAAVKP